MTAKYDPNVQMIPISQINILNPRERGKKKFDRIVENIAHLGLKKPVTVARANGKNDDAQFDLVCGQGRLEAYQQLGETEIPAIVVEGTKEELLLMSLAENLARRNHSTIELVREINALKQRGYSVTEIAHKTDLDQAYVRGVLQLLEKGEGRLLREVEKGRMPLSIAIAIAMSDDKAVQQAMQAAYEHKDLRGRALIRVRQLIEKRKRKRSPGEPRQAPDRPMTVETLLKTFQRETMRQKLTVHKAKVCETRLLFAVSAVKQLFADEHFVTLLRAEGLDSLPQCLADQINGTKETP